MKLTNRAIGASLCWLSLVDAIPRLNRQSAEAATRPWSAEKNPELAQLVPDYLDHVPRDPHVDAELQYRRSGGDYLLYSVGPNAEDEEGRDEESEPYGDDVAIRTAPRE